MICKVLLSLCQRVHDTFFSVPEPGLAVSSAPRTLKLKAWRQKARTEGGILLWSSLIASQLLSAVDPTPTVPAFS